ncbi:MAG TPA: adenylate/guanylate cyclase domain-containing protein [Methylomirabilota bacterium]|nr:adenylate/guanylate cyclase domain-containing protein [Methylomirabilota bacterium]
MAATLRFDSELGSFVDEITADLCRFECASTAGCAPAHVSIEREVMLAAGVHADVRVQAPKAAAYFVENKLEYSAADLVARIRRKYAAASPAWRGAQRLAVLLDRRTVPAGTNIDALLRDAAPGLEVEVWNVTDFLERIRTTFGVEITGISRASLLDVRSAIEQAQWRTAYDGKFPGDARTTTLLWHFSPWELARLYREQGIGPNDLLQAKIYEDAIILMADMCSFSSYVRDTRDPAVTHRRLTEYYSLARSAVLNEGGMLYQFVGDEVVGVFGLYGSPAVAAEQALRCARTLCEAGNAVSTAWQRTLDRVQPSHGVHIGVGMGPLGLLAWRPFSRTHVGFIGEPLNLAARLMGQAQSSEIIATNTFYSALDGERRGLFDEVGAIEAKNVGRIQGWRTTYATLEAARGKA